MVVGWDSEVARLMGPPRDGAAEEAITSLPLLPVTVPTEGMHTANYYLSHFETSIVLSFQWVPFIVSDCRITHSGIHSLSLHATLAMGA